MFSHQNSQLLLTHEKRCLVSHWPVAVQFENLMTTVVDGMAGELHGHGVGTACCV
jgi:hypothetical protein